VLPQAKETIIEKEESMENRLKELFWLTHTLCKVVVGCHHRLQALWCITENRDVISVLSLSDEFCKKFGLRFEPALIEKITVIAESDLYSASVLDFLEGEPK